MRNVSSLETVYRDYRDRGVQFYYVYKAVQHPEINNMVSAYSVEERLQHIAEAKRRLQTEIPWICDTMDNTFKHAFGNAPNGEFLLGPEGKLIRKRFWSDPAKLRAELVERIGPVDPVTTVDQVSAGFEAETRSIASGVVPRPKLPAGLRPLTIQPQRDSAQPHFAKLRAEATRQLLEDGHGKLYLGVHLDPLYSVHWNNRAGKVTVKIEASAGVEVSPAAAASPEVEEDADIDPRDFLFDIENASDQTKLQVTVAYVACDDAETFCEPVTQRYEVTLEANRDLGSRPGIFMPALFAEVHSLDANGDGDLTADELPEGEVTLYIGHMDYNGNEVIEKAEIETFLRMFNNGRGFDSSANDGDD